MKREHIKFSDLFNVKHGYAFKSQFFDSSGPYVLLTPGNFHEAGGFRDVGEKQKYYTGDVPEGFILEDGDLLVAMTEQAEGLLGSTAWIPCSGKYLHNQRLGRIVELNEANLDKRYLYYLFNTREVRHQIAASASGTKVRHTAPERIGRVEVDLPPINSQRRIATTLLAYDDLIENNRRRIQLLEQSARQLHQEWFVQLRFPGHKHVKVSGGVPEGWETKKMRDVCESIGGGTPSTSRPEYWEGGNITWVTPSDITRNNCLALLDSEKKITEAGLKNSSAKMLPPETILMTSRASLGFFGLVDREVCTNQGFIAVVPNEEHFRMYLLHNLMSRKEEIIGKAGGTTYKEINKSTFRELDIVIPSHPLLTEFSEFARDTLRQVRLLKKQEGKLHAARDLLLPRLMDGTITV